MHNEVILHRLAAAQSILFNGNTRAAAGGHDVKNAVNLSHSKE
jgi:hypothetical protein